MIRKMDDIGPDGRAKIYRFRVTTFRAARGPWRASRKEAMDDAIDLGLASWDDSKKEHFLAVPVAIAAEPVSRAPALPLPTRDAPRPWSAEDTTDLRRLARARWKAEEIARKIGRSAEAVAKHAGVLGITLRTTAGDRRNIRDALD